MVNLKHFINFFRDRRIVSAEYLSKLEKNVKELEKDVKEGFTDEQTGLPNGKKLFRDAQMRSGYLAFVDLDKMKELNSQFGYDNTDLILTSFGHHLSHIVSNLFLDANVYRRYNSGDEFIVIFSEKPTEEAIELLSSHVVNLLLHPSVEMGNVIVNATIGDVFQFDPHENPVRETLKLASMSCLAIKSKKKKRPQLAFKMILRSDTEAVSTLLH